MKTDGRDAAAKGRPADRPLAPGLKDTLNSDYVRARFAEVLGAKAPAFIASILSATQRNPELAKCDQTSILASAMMAATLDLPIDSNLGFAALVPYRTKSGEAWVSVAQFQIMYKGFIQLALRTGQYKTINVTPVYEDEIDSYDIITGDLKVRPVVGGHRDAEREEKIVGYAAFFRLLNGFERTDYWPIGKIKSHGERFSKTYSNSNGLWKKDPHAMYSKTVLKNVLSKWGILSVEMRSAVAIDQAVLRDFRKPIDAENVDYVDAMPADAREEDAPEPAAQSHGENLAAKAAASASAEPRPAPEAEQPREGESLFDADEEAALEEQYRRREANSGPEWD
ncbi:MAG: recombinase RecT [Treponema sp.]|nr:recombinase RecT [Treponema sp.]